MLNPTPTIMLTETELEAAQKFMAAGRLPPDFLARYYAVIDQQNPENKIPEHGLGSKNNQTGNSLAALKKAEQLGREPKGAYDKVVAEIWKSDPGRAAQLHLPSRELAPPNPTEN